MTQLINFKNIHVMAGSVDFNNIPDIPFNEHSISFLSELSKNIRNSSIAKNYPDVMALSFWCRQGNLQVMKTKQTNLTRRIGRGLVFHVTPSNVPLNFVYFLTYQHYSTLFYPILYVNHLLFFHP